MPNYTFIDLSPQMVEKCNKSISLPNYYREYGGHWKNIDEWYKRFSTIVKCFGINYKIPHHLERCTHKNSTNYNKISDIERFIMGQITVLQSDDTQKSIDFTKNYHCCWCDFFCSLTLLLGVFESTVWCIFFKSAFIERKMTPHKLKKYENISKLVKLNQISEKKINKSYKANMELHYSYSLTFLALQRILPYIGPIL